ncbi:MAG: helix-turn-helix transcriptional regulator [Pseudoflavonifractor sp.]|nr:helix-turn-helix transcriptional regulator [Pseudoflavonifractor sp.]
MFYERYLKLCAEKGISPSSAAINAGFNKGTVSVWKKKYESGTDVVPEQDVINKICAYFKCSEQWVRGIRQKETPTPVSESGRNIIKIAGRDGSFVERHVTDEQAAIFKSMLDQMKPVDDDSI